MASTDAPDVPDTPDEGSSVLDRSTGRLVEFLGVANGCWRLRPMICDCYREVRPEDVLAPEPDEPPTAARTPLPPPEPVPDCAECDDWWWAEQLATGDGALSEATDCRVFLRRHLAVRHGDMEGT
ncbi:hypothetical protein [Streptomyces sp. NPDC093109]|uniref:hypothetical protein n=1 Tax=Streptomyces sp. NPDC093109 TaxID=3154977 RepID=UPI00344D1B52